MRPEINEIEARILGCLIEKEATTPDNYPLTVNSLMLACNQKTNRWPVVDYDESTVTDALDSLRDKNLVYLAYSGGSRVAKYKHLLPKILDLRFPETALMCVLMLRGPQTPGEIKGRTGRIYSFASLDQVEETLGELEKKDEPLVVNLGRQPGQKEARYAHLLCGELDPADFGQQVAPSGGNARIASLEEEVATLKTSLEELREEFQEFKAGFE
ncbi:MAG: YceH family protein [Pyrinomonadaceae bacterium]